MPAAAGACCRTVLQVPTQDGKIGPPQRHCSADRWPKGRHYTAAMRMHHVSARPLPARFVSGLLPALTVLALVCTALPASAQWKWRGKDGSVNVSDRPPPRDVADKDILSRPPEVRRNTGAPAVNAASAASGPALAVPAAGPLDRELEARKRAGEQEQAAKTKAEEERLATTRAANCRRARSQQAALDSGQRMARVNEKGEREVLDDRARADESRQVREIIASDCR